MYQRRTDCIRLVAIGVLLAGTLLALPAGGQEPATVIAQINALRDDEELNGIAASPALDLVAARYVESIIAARCLCPVAGAPSEVNHLLDDVETALDYGGTLLDIGLVAGYDRTPAGAIATAIHDPANAAAILGRRMDLAGIATGVIEPNQSWLAPPPGGAGPDIDLSGYTVVVIVLAGSTP